MPKKVNTIVINNFGGRLTRIINGDLNSGFAKFDTSFGYDPFTKPGNLTWFQSPTSVAGFVDLVVGGLISPRSREGIQHGYFVGSTGKLYDMRVNVTPSLIQLNVDSVLARQSIHGDYSYGASMIFFGDKEELYVGGKDGIVKVGSVVGQGGQIVLNGASSVITNQSFLSGNVRPMVPFAGKLIFGNGPTIGAIDSTGTVVSSIFTISQLEGNKYSQLFPALPSDEVVRDLEVSVDGNYLEIASTNVLPENIATLDPQSALTAVSAGKGALYGWNGVDSGVTMALQIPAGAVTSQQTYLQEKVFFLNDFFGSAVSDGRKKLVSLPLNSPPNPNAATNTGNFLVWATVDNQTEDTDDVATSVYYFGSFDDENPAGLYRVLRFQPGDLLPTDEDFDTIQVPYFDIISNRSRSYTFFSPQVILPTLFSRGKHYISTFQSETFSLSSVFSSSVTGNHRFWSFNTSGFDIQAGYQPGVYETQTQLFEKRVKIEQIRVYIEPPVRTNQGFRLDIIGQDGEPIDNGTFTFTFGDPIDKNERINFNPAVDAGYGFAIRVTNTGTSATTSMVIKKIEIDWTPSGK
jgi:hypothetical protein